MFTSAPTGVDSSAWDFARHFTDVGGLRTRNAIFVNARAFAALSPADQAAVTAAAARADTRGRVAAQAAEQDMLGKLREKGMEIATASPALMAQLRAVGAKQTAEWEQRAGADGTRMLARFKELMGQ
jgi:TRAP-type C4-dicarboxylate transport system substrate-binding protein